jgi:hypothetical protein
MNRKRFNSSINGQELDLFTDASNISTSISHLSDVKEPPLEGVHDQQLLTRIARIWSDMRLLKQQINGGENTTIQPFSEATNAAVSIMPQIPLVEERTRKLSGYIEKHVGSSEATRVSSLADLISSSFNKDVSAARPAGNLALES